MVKKKNKRRTGRPSKMESLDLDKVKQLALKGFTDKEISKFFGFTEQTLNNLKKKHPSFFASLKDWKIEADAHVEKSLYERACGCYTTEDRMVDGEKVEFRRYYPPDPTSMIFWLKNRQRENWRDKQEIDHGFKDTLFTDFEGMDIKQLAKELHELEQKRSGSGNQAQT